jgi:uncharacterized membrane protein HdeD (DUF308 family)
MQKYVIAGLSIIISGVVILLFSLISQAITTATISLPLLIGGSIVMVEGRKVKSSLFVCGECNLTFIEESDLRKHYAVEHSKK